MTSIDTPAFGPDFELPRLERFLGQRFGAASDFRCERIAGAVESDLLCRLRRAADVLRKKPAGPILKGAHAVEREFRVLEALSTTNVPVPRTISSQRTRALSARPSI